MKEAEKRTKEMADLIAKNPSLELSYYIEAMIINLTLINDSPDNKICLDLLKNGVARNKCAGSACYLLFYHIEPCKLNNGIPDYECEEGIKYILDVVKHKGIISFLDHQVT